MTKAEALEFWKRYHLPAIREVECLWGRGSGKPNRTMRVKDWNGFVDQLCAEGKVTVGRRWAIPKVVGG